MPEQFEILDASDRSLLVQVGDGTRVTALLRDLEFDPPAGVVNLHPAYSSILVVFDPLVAERGALVREITRRAQTTGHGPAPPGRLVEIPVLYDGPDLNDVAEHHGITRAQVVEEHASALYTVAFLGFLPGFAYLSGLPESLATPRLATPRPAVPAGSVAIAGAQTAVYPVATPGGWRLIGRTSTRMFDLDRPGFALLRTGDTVRFVPVCQ